MSTAALAPAPAPVTVATVPGRSWWALFCSTVLLAGAGAVLMGPLWTHSTAVALATAVLSASLSATGAILWAEAGQRLTATLLALVGLLWAAGWVDEWGGGPLPLIATLCSPVALVIGAWAVLRYPDPARVDGATRLFLVALAGWVLGGQIAYDVTDRAAWSGYANGTWWLTVHADRGLRDAIENIADAGCAVLAGLFLALWLRRFRQTRGLDRRLFAPMAMVAPAAAVVSAAVPVAQLLGLRGGALNAGYAVETTLLAAVPCAFLIMVIRRRLASTAVLGLVREVQRRPTPEAVQQSLQGVLDDPTLRVSYWAPELESYVDVGGLRVDVPADGERRLVVPVRSGSGQPLAVIDTDPELRRLPEVVAGAVSAAGLALENAQLQAALRAQLGEVRTSRLRTVEAGVSERRRLERDLHDGAQQRLLALRLALVTADDGTLLPSTKAFLAEVSQEIGGALAELRELARGIHPAVLSQAGLPAAVEAVVERQEMVIDTTLPPQRFPAATEATAYVIICEAVENAVRHAEATRVQIRGHASDGILTIEVEDDGRGGAQVQVGAGLGGLIDRVRALGGDMMLSSPPGGGTLMVAAIPCG